MTAEGFLQRQARSCLVQPLSAPVASNSDAFAAELGLRKLGWRVARRKLIYAGLGQERHRLDALPPGGRRILWIYDGMAQIGDALMDLAPRSLLAEQGYEVSLLTSPALAAVFRGDAWLQGVHDEHHPPDAVFDGALVLNFMRRSFPLKRRLFPRLPWVCLQQHYVGPDFHRAEFATRRLADLTGSPLSVSAFQRHARQKLDTPAVASPSVDRPGLAPGYVVLGLGGVDPVRTYTQWTALARWILDGTPLGVALTGSDNGRQAASDLIEALPPALRARVADFTGRTTLAQSQALMRQAALVVCADGGLMHLAFTTSTPVVALFHRSIDPAWRLPRDPHIIALRSTGAVSELSAQQIGQACRLLLEPALATLHGFHESTAVRAHA
ncbi:glycosyltransferase family 9 protein [Variovorax terrae]|uniref:Glycosyltransferase family 9 protein n=1 Tax=Variovorax terrae TaxID=2923278 RepID=A0A9X1VZI1_9BURK|nr:glycosyltransferase family 9 protein [Variovorax terrae]MCJ0763328.1 hypothetical protein [Variovorax terrae]